MVRHSENNPSCKISLHKLKWLLCTTGFALAACGGGGGGGGSTVADAGPSPSSSNALRTGNLVYTYINEPFAVDMKTGTTRRLMPRDNKLSIKGPGAGPNGEFAVAYNTELSGTTSRLVILKPDGSIERTAFFNYTIESNPRFSPDGSKIAFVAGIYKNGIQDLFAQVVSRSGDRLYFYAGYDVPKWLPDGRLVLAGKNGLYVADPNTDNAPTLIPNSQNTLSSAISVDGQKIAFVRGVPRRDVYVMGIDGSGTRQVTALKNADIGTVAFSPDGKELAVTTLGCYGWTTSEGLGTGIGDADDNLLHVIAANASMLDLKINRRSSPTVLNEENGSGRCSRGPIGWR